MKDAVIEWLVCFAHIVFSQEAGVPLGAALLGGFLSLLGAFFAAKLANAEASRVRKNERRRAEARNAYAVFSTIMNADSHVKNLNHHISSSFEDAKEAGHVDMEPAAKVLQLIGCISEPLKLDQTHLLFLIESGQAELINDVNFCVRSTTASFTMMEAYNSYRAKLDDFFEVNGDNAEFGEGTHLSTTLKGRAGIQGDLQIRRLNSILGQLMERLERDGPKTEKTLNEFQKAASAHFGTLFPVFEIRRDEHN